MISCGQEEEIIPRLLLTRSIKRVAVPVGIPPERHADVSDGAGLRADEAESRVPGPRGERLLQLGLDVRLVPKLASPILDAAKRVDDMKDYAPSRRGIFGPCVLRKISKGTGLG